MLKIRCPKDKCKYHLFNKERYLRGIIEIPCKKCKIIWRIVFSKDNPKGNFTEANRSEIA